MDKASELVLAVPTKQAMPEDWHGLNQSLLKNFEKVVRVYGKFKRRGIPGEKGLENDPSWKQIIPYMVFKFQDKYFLMQRGSKGHENRLHNKYTLGIGGHINREDLQKKSIVDWGIREFEEEVEYGGNLKATVLGLLNDSNDQVGGVHLGYAILLEGDSDQIKAKEELRSGKLATIDEIKGNYDQMETWSQMVFDYLKSTYSKTNGYLDPNKMMTGQKGIWIAFEGNEGSGKSTQIQKLTDYMRLQGYNVIQTREPGGNDFSEELRRLIFNQEVSDDPKTQLLLFTAARRRNIIKTVLPAIKEGHIVLSDRSEGSTYAYQYAQFGLPFEQVHSINDFATDEIKPDLIIVLDVDVEVGMQRARQAKGVDATHFDQADLLSSIKRTLGYLRLANKYDNWVVLDVNKSIDEVFGDLLKILKEKRVLK